ncbi:cuticle protein 16.8-like [Ornithodoros turicata]|uniref:cuticle protein 16.8-like n=1 Tax=Ornithodoros turicata TaxID=34597 RepID=UPI00313990BA
MRTKTLLICLIGFVAAQDDYPPQPYSFSYDNTDEYGNRLAQSETGDERNTKTGSYSFQTADGIYRKVDYIADENGFRATVNTNEPGTKAENPADVIFNASPLGSPPTQAVQSAPVQIAAPVTTAVAARPVHVVATAPAVHPVAVHAVHAVHSPTVALHAAPVAVHAVHAAAPAYTFAAQHVPTVAVAAAPHHVPVAYTLAHPGRR